MEASNLPDNEFKTLVVKMFNELRGRIDRFSENLQRDRNHKNEPVRNKGYNRRNQQQVR